MRYSLFLFFLCTSCTYNELITICEPDEQEFFELVQPIIQSNCISCHSQSGGLPPVLETFDDVVDAVKEQSLKYQVTSREMPPYGVDPLSSSEINIIAKWADCE